MRSNIQQLLRRYKISRITESFSGLTKQENDFCKYVFETFENSQRYGYDNNCYYNSDSLLVFEYADDSKLLINTRIWEKLTFLLNISSCSEITLAIRNIVEYICDIKISEEYIWRKSFKYK